MRIVFLNTLLVVLLIFASLLQAGTFVNREGFVVDNLAQAVRLYQIKNDGRLPNSWRELRQVFNADLMERRLGISGSFSIEDHYQFLPKPVFFGTSEDVNGIGRVLLIRTVPVESASASEPAEQWRSLVVISDDGVVSAIRRPEADVQSILNSAGITVFPKDGMPKIEFEPELPSRSEGPQPNPADADFLREHPELDPSSKQSKTAFKSNSVLSSSRSQSGNTEPGNKGFSILSLCFSFALIIAIVVFFVVKRFRRR